MKLRNLLSALVLVLGLQTASSAVADYLGLSEFCDLPGVGVWDASTKTCNAIREPLSLGPFDSLLIEADETLYVKDSLDFSYFRGLVINAGTIILDDANPLFDRLVNLGVVDHGGDPGDALVLGSGRGNANYNAGLIVSRARIVVITSLDNSGEIVNQGLLQNLGLLDNRGSIDTTAGEVENYATGIIRNYRCPGSQGVISAGSSRITNEGTIEFVNGRDC